MLFRPKQSNAKDMAENRQEKPFKKADKRHRLNGNVFCSMSLDEELTVTVTNMTQVSYVGRHPQP